MTHVAEEQQPEATLTACASMEKEKDKMTDSAEDGEITDDEDDLISDEANSSIGTYPNKAEKDEDVLKSDDETPEEVLNDIAKQIVEKISESKRNLPAIDLTLCHVCQKVAHKYRCPRCNIKSCSLHCSKQHKNDNECDGVRQPFTKVEKLSHFDASKSIEDQTFFHNVKEAAGFHVESSSTTSNLEVRKDERVESSAKPDDLRYNPNSGTERYLLNASRGRRIWLGFSEQPKENESRHEFHSDTIFWTLDILFRKQLEDGEFEEYAKTVHNIPESIRIVTVLKQFLKPRVHGTVVSEADLDMEKMKPFIDRGLDDVNIYMNVHSIPNKYYGIVAEKTLLENIRNTVVVDHPKLIVTLNNELASMELISKEDSEALQGRFGGVSGPFRGNNNMRGNGRGRGGGRGSHGGGGGFGQRRGGSFQQLNNFDKRKRRFNDAGGAYGDQWKRGRGRGGFAGRPNFNRSGPPAEGFDPFEPFCGPISLPID